MTPLAGLAGWPAVGCLLVAAAAVVAWPSQAARARRRRLLQPGGSGRGRLIPTARWLAATIADGQPGETRRLRSTRSGSRPGGRRHRAGRRPTGWHCSKQPLSLAAAPVLTGVLAAAVGGPVAAGVAAAYTAVAMWALQRRRRQGWQAERRATVLDLLSSAAADLRAGLPVQTALAELADLARSATAGTPAPPMPAPVALLVARVWAAVQLAETTGAPAAEVLERIEVDARGDDRATASAAAQVAGARATTWLLAALPLAGLGLGYTIGADPLAVLLHTPVGAACAAGALLLQLGGLAWTGRIMRPAAAAGVG